MDSLARNWVIVGIAAALVAVPVLVYQAGTQTQHQAPDFTLTSTGYENGTLGEPVRFSLSDYRNKTVLLDFMAIACTSCRQLEQQVLVPLHEEFGQDDGFVLLSIDVWAAPASKNHFPGETRENLVRFQQETNHTWRHALDDDEVFRKYDAVALPKLAVIGPEGQIVAEWSGQPSHRTVRDAVVASMEGGAPPTKAFRFENVLSGPAVYLGVALVAGVASFFAPCSVGLMPAYLGVLLRSSEKDAAGAAARTLRAGVATGAGIVSIYAAIAGVLWALSSAGTGWVGHIDKLRPVMAAALIVLGLALFWNVSWDWLARRMGKGSIDGRRGFFAFGLGYGLAAFGCTGPIFLPTLVLAFAHSPATGVASFVVYSLAVAGFVLLAAALVAGGHQTRLRTILARTDVITKLSAVLLVVAGAWLLWYDWRAGVLG